MVEPSPLSSGPARYLISIALGLMLVIAVGGTLTFRPDEPGSEGPLAAARPDAKPPPPSTTKVAPVPVEKPPVESSPKGSERPAAPPATLALHAASQQIGGLAIPATDDLASFSGKVLAVVKPRRPLSPEEVETIVQRVNDGMGLLLVGDGGEDNVNLNPLAGRFGINFNNDIVSTMDQTGATSVTPHLYSMLHPITQDIQYFQVDRSCSLMLGDWNAQALLFSSPESFSDADRSGTWEQGEYVGSCAVLAKAEHGQGRVVVIGDAVMFERRDREDKALLDRIYQWLNHKI